MPLTKTELEAVMEDIKAKSFREFSQQIEDLGLASYPKGRDRAIMLHDVEESLTKHLAPEAKQEAAVPEGYKVEAGSDAYKEVIVTAPDQGQQIFWPEDAAYGLIKAMIGATNDKQD